MPETVVNVNLGQRSYSIHIGQELLAQIGSLLGARHTGQRVIVVTDSNVGPCYSQSVLKSLSERGMHAHVVTIPAGESSKTLREASLVYDAMISARADRRSLVIALGGGVVGDLAGFVAATYARGIPFVQAPTTLLAMVDASVGGKVAVDHPRAKNMIGAFHQPTLVVCDLNCLATLPKREVRCGLAEIVKHGVILDAELFAYCEANVDAINCQDPDVLGHLVIESCRIKGGVVEADEHETKGVRSVLNYGHTFAHAFETAGGYELLQHGEAVAIGMACAGRLAARVGLVDFQFCERQEQLLERLGLPTRIPRSILRHDLVALMKHDKKSHDQKVRFVLPKGVGQVHMVEIVRLDLVEEVLRQRAAKSE